MLRNRTLLAISFTVFAAYVGGDMIIPVRVLFAQSHGASLAIIGAMTSAFLIANFAFQYPFGWLADRWGRKQVMLIGLTAQAALSLVYLLISDPVLFVVSTVIQFVEQTWTSAVRAALIQSDLPSVPAPFQEVIRSGHVLERMKVGTSPLQTNASCTTLRVPYGTGLACQSWSGCPSDRLLLSAL